MASKYGSRKFIVAIVSLLGSLGLAIASKLSGEFVTVVSVVNVAYPAANALVHRARGEAQ